MKLKEQIEHEKWVNQEVSSEDKTLFRQILLLYENEEVYRTPRLKMSSIAQRTDSSIHEVSRCINVCARMHFFDFTNYYRVQAVMKLLRSQEENNKYTIEGIAYKCGFSNRTSFNKAFRKVTKKTPTEFKLMG